MPMRNHEVVLVFYNKLPTYNPQKMTGYESKTAWGANLQIMVRLKFANKD
jgi:hypothetical protein